MIRGDSKDDRREAPNVELILTGLSAPTETIETADLVADMVELKDWYYKGISRRLGIEFYKKMLSASSCVLRSSDFSVLVSAWHLLTPGRASIVELVLVNLDV